MCLASSVGRPPRLRGKRVLVVEDEALVSMLIEDELRGAGATVLGPAICVDDALRLVEAAAADRGIGAAVLDINLEGRHVTPVADKLAALGVPFLSARGILAPPVFPDGARTLQRLADLPSLPAANRAANRAAFELDRVGRTGGQGGGGAGGGRG